MHYFVCCMNQWKVKQNSTELSSYLILCGERRPGRMGCLKGICECSKPPSKEAHPYLLDWETSSFFQPGKRKWAGVCSIERHKPLSEHVNSAFIPEGFFFLRKKNDTSSILEFSVREFSFSTFYMSHCSEHQSTQVVIFALWKEKQSWKR